MSFEEFFKLRFVRFLRANFRNAVDVAAAFGVRERTAENWLEGVNTPSGAAIGRALMRPDLRGSLLDCLDGGDRPDGTR